MSKVKQSPAFYVLSFTSMWERFSYYGMRAFLILYMANDIANPETGHLGGLGFSDGFAGGVYGVFNGLCYLLPLFGGYLSDKLLGERRSIFIGGVLIMIGHFTLATDAGLVPFFTGLTLLAVGNGFFKPTTVTLIGDLYEQGDKRRDSAFTIYYMIFNGGAILAPLICGYFGPEYGYRYGFLAAGIGMFVGLVIYLALGKKYLGDMGKVAKQKLQAAADKANNTKTVKQPLTKEDVDRIRVIVVLLFLTTFFWASFEQAGSTLNLFTERYINKTVLGWEIPTPWLQSVNPIFVLALSPLFSWFWLWLNNRGKNPPTPVKMAIGMIILGSGFLFMLGAVIQRGGDVADESVKAGLFWLLSFYLFSTIGELFVSPIGLSMVTKLAPARMGSFFMGVWFLSFFIAHVIGGLAVEVFSKLGGHTLFLAIFGIMIVLGVVVFILSKKLIYWMHGRD